MALAKDVNLLLILGVAGFLLASALWIILARRATPEERERRRRLAVNRHQRIVEGSITEAGDQLIHYQYELRGVAYFTSQDVVSLREMLPRDPSRLMGPVSVKYDPRNPADSIIICEDWSGLPALPPISEEEQA